MNVADLLTSRPEPSQPGMTATVASVAPPTVTLDGTTGPVPCVPLCTLEAGARALVLRVGGTLYVLGTFGGCPYAVGDVYATVSSVHPADRWPGTSWEAYAQGRVLVGLDPSDQSFDTVGETGGEKAHTLTLNEIPAHTHSYTRYLYMRSEATGSAPNGWQATQTGETGSAGGGQAHNNLQPYVVVLLWRRTA